DAMNNAVFYQKGIGNDDKAIADTKYFVDTFGHKKPAEAAAAAYSLVSIYEKRNDNDAVIKHLQDYIHVWGAKGGEDKLVVAHAKIAKILWHQSCPVKEVDGVCVKVTRERAVVTKKVTKKKGKETYVAPLQCGPESKIKLTVVKRDDRKKGEALREFAMSGAEFNKMKGEEKDAGFGGARYWYAMGKFIEADVDYEKYLDIKFPANLNFGDGLPEHKKQNEELSKKSGARFKEWITTKTKAADSANGKYSKVLEIKDNANS